MHEIGICESVLAAVERRAQGRSVAGFKVRVGALLRVVPEAFAQSFEMVSTGTIAEGATPDLVIEPVRGTCDACGQTLESGDAIPACAACGSVRISRDGGDDLVLESIRYHAAAEPAQPAERSS